MTEAELLELGRVVRCKGFKYTTWIPTKPDNLSKLEEHYWDGRQWVPTNHVRFVPSLDWGCDERELKTTNTGGVP